MNKPLLGSDSESDDEGSSSTGGGVMGLGSLKNALNKLVPYGFDQHANLNEAFPWSIAALMRTTNNFTHENILGQGGSGIVYKGNFGNGNMIAVKRMQCRSGFEFESQLAVLQKVGHTQHLVALLGYCMDGNERIFVYEYMSQGSLSRHLFDSEAEPLGWDRRLLIALDVARAVDFLHTSGHIHGDLKPSNVLLQKDMSAKIADFGIAQHGKCSGAFGYLAPECTTAKGGVTTKVDVYSFGVLLMELLTGRRAFNSSQPEDSMHLVPWFQSMYVAKDTFFTAIDHTIINEESLASIHTVADLAVHCTASEPDQRLDMSNVVTLLSSLVE